MKLKNSSLLLLTGILVGALAGLLLAPDEGAKTRKKLFKKAKKYKDIIEEKAGEYKEKASEFKENVEKTANDLKKKYS